MESIPLTLLPLVIHILVIEQLFWLCGIAPASWCDIFVFLCTGMYVISWSYNAAIVIRNCFFVGVIVWYWHMGFCYSIALGAFKSVALMVEFLRIITYYSKLLCSYYFMSYRTICSWRYGSFVVHMYDAVVCDVSLNYCARYVAIFISTSIFMVSKCLQTLWSDHQNFCISIGWLVCKVNCCREDIFTADSDAAQYLTLQF